MDKNGGAWKQVGDSGTWFRNPAPAAVPPEPEPEPPITPEEREEVRLAFDAGEPAPDIYGAADMQLWRARKAEAGVVADREAGQ